MIGGRGSVILLRQGFLLRRLLRQGQEGFGGQDGGQVGDRGEKDAVIARVKGFGLRDLGFFEIFTC